MHVPPLRQTLYKAVLFKHLWSTIFVVTPTTHVALIVRAMQLLSGIDPPMCNELVKLSLRDVMSRVVVMPVAMIDHVVEWHQQMVVGPATDHGYGMRP